MHVIIPPVTDRPSTHDLAFDTLAVHAGLEPDELTGAVSPPIYQTSTYAQDAVGRPRRGYEYARTQNPTRERLERAVATLEGGRFGIAFASGSATTATLADLVDPGEALLVCSDVYGGTYRFFERVARPRGVEPRFADLSGDAGPDVAARLLGERTRMVWFETPTNPHLRVVDIVGVAKSAHSHRGARGERPIVVVDNTFASPALQRPLDLGADVVVHSATKFLGGHSDTVLGVAVTNDEGIAERLRFLQNASGAVPGPFDCFLVLRGLRTLALRMARHSANGLAIARFLAERPDVAWLSYPGLDDGPHAHPNSAIARRQMHWPDATRRNVRAGGGMVSFIPGRGGRHGRSARDRAVAICEATRVFALAESRGGVESLIEVPAIMTHASVSGSAREVDEALIRLSVGVEDPNDLIEDLRRALDEA